MVGEGCSLLKSIIIPKVRAKYRRTTHNFEIWFPKKVCEAYKIDQQIGTTVWGKSIEK